MKMFDSLWDRDLNILFPKDEGMRHKQAGRSKKMRDKKCARFILTGAKFFDFGSGKFRAKQYQRLASAQDDGAYFGKASCSGIGLL
jgi:hypothetical protein